MNFQAPDFLRIIKNEITVLNRLVGRLINKDNYLT